MPPANAVGSVPITTLQSDYEWMVHFVVYKNEMHTMLANREMAILANRI